jgi:glycosyltransferase involved in cell wall biosynthesis
MLAKKILFLSPYPKDVAPSQRLKFEQYFAHFEKAGFEITTNSFISITFWQFIYLPGKSFKKMVYTILAYFKRFKIILTLKKYDVIYVHLWVTPFGPPVFEWLLTKIHKKIIYDIDDLVYLKANKSKSNQLISFIKGRQKPIFLMKMANHVITCTPHLDEFVRKYNLNTTDISSTINTDTYQVVKNYKNDHTLVLGWSGSHSTSKYLYLLKDVLIELNQDYPFKLMVMGDANFNIEGLDVEALAWREEIEISTLQRFDIGLYPLPDEQWVLGKSGLKALQYMALGLPVVATAIGANYRVITDNETGFLVNTEEEWLIALKQLIENEKLRESFGTKGRAKVETSYSIKATAPTYLKILNELIES